MTEHSIEEPPDDVAEQSQQAFPGEDDADSGPGERPLEADEADAAEQSRVVDIDDEGY